MHRASWTQPHLRLVAVFLVLVLLPSFFLGYFSLRAVETERRAARVRVLENYRRYAGIASRAVRYQLIELEGSWQDLVPVRSGWMERLDAIAAALDPPALADRAVRSAWVFGTDGIVLRSAPGEEPSTS